MIAFHEAWAADFEYCVVPGERPWPHCMVARELNSGREIRLWRDGLLALDRAPFDTGPNSVFTAFYASAELGCFLELGWPLPKNVIDLYAEHRVATNGLKLLSDDKTRAKDDLLGALIVRNLAHIDAGHKKAMQQLAGNKQFSLEQQRELVDYCAVDVEALAALWPVMAPSIDRPRALIRGRYMAAAARMERTGVPVDVLLHRRLVENWDSIKEHLIADVDKDFHVFDGTTFKRDWFVRYLVEHHIPWPQLPSGQLELKEETFEDQARIDPRLRPLYELRASLGTMRLTGFEIGSDSRTRCMLSAFQSITGRNQPSSTKFVFGPARWMRGLIREKEGRALAYIDWSTQEVAIAAALSGDERLMEACRDDPHLSFAKEVGLAPLDATKESHEAIRERCKTVVLGTNYGMGARTVALRAEVSLSEASELLRLHRITYRKFWRWVDAQVDTAMVRREMQTTFGWRLFVTRDANPRSLMNWQMQSNGSEMMRLAAIAGTEAGIEVCCPVHDAFLISAPIDRIDADVAKMREIMSKASRTVTGGFEVRTDVKIVQAPVRYMDKRGAEMWGRVMGWLEQIECEEESLAVTRCVRMTCPWKRVNR
jgi:DNA polymerase family A